MIVAAYTISAGVGLVNALVSDNVAAAITAGVFGLVGIVLQIVVSWRTSRIEHAAKEAKTKAEATDARAVETDARVQVTLALLDERKNENQLLHRRVEQLIGALVAQGRQIPDERQADLGPDGPERRDPDAPQT